jgi:hypothetical protein
MHSLGCLFPSCSKQEGPLICLSLMAPSPDLGTR